MGVTEPHASNVGEKIGCGGCALPLGILLITVGVTVTVFYFGDVHQTQTLHAGDETQFDPIAALPYAKALAATDGEQLEFLEMTARFVRSDGTLDLSADYEPDVVYQWIGPPLAADDRPVGAPGKETRVTVVTVRATRLGFEHTGSSNDGEYYDLNLGLRRSESQRSASHVTAAGPPRCDFARLWKAAIDKGAPADAVAIIHYSADGYTFRVDGTDINLSFGTDCKLRE